MMRYGRISPGQLAQFEREIDDLMIDSTLPIEVVFNKIEDLLDYGEIAQAPYTPLQAVNKGYNIINKTGMYNEYIKTWLRRSLNQRTWMNFKTHFQEAYDELQQTGQLTLQQAGYGNSNLVEEVVARVANEVEAQLNVIQEAIILKQVPDTVSLTCQLAPHVSPTVKITTTDALIQLMKQNQEMLRILASSNNGRDVRTNRPPPTGPREGQPTRPLSTWCTKYCWTHGKSSHKNINCKNKAPGHKDNATFQNKFGGSTYGCE